MARSFTRVIQSITIGPVRVIQALNGIRMIFLASFIIEESTPLTVFRTVFSRFIFMLPVIFPVVSVFMYVSVTTIPPVVMLVIIIRFITALAKGDMVIGIHAFAGATGAFQVMRFPVSVFLVSMWIKTVAPTG